MTTRTNKSEFARALDRLTRYLALRDHSRLELRTKLLRNFEPEIVDQVLAQAEENAWISSEEEIAARTALAYQRQMKSRRYIEGQLLKRGLPLPQRDDETELENARNLVRKKFGQVTELSLEEREKASRFLKYRGFSDQMIRMVFRAES